MEKIQGVLEAQLEDEMTDFNARDFKKMEREDERFRQARKKESEEYYIGHNVMPSQ